jgi:hypothetical protein
MCSGFGVFATRNFEEREFLLDYAGELISPNVGDSKDNQEYLYYFKFAGKSFWYVYM